MQSMNRHGTPPFIHSSPKTIIIVINSNRSPKKLISNASPIISQGSYSCTGRGIKIVPGVGILSSGCIPSSTADAGSTKTPAATIQFHRRIQSHPSLPTTHTILRRRQYCILPLRRYNPERPLPLLPKQFLRQIQSHRFLLTTHTILRRRITSSFNMEDDPSTSVSIHPTAVPDNHWIQMRRCNASHVHGEVSLFSLPCFLFTITMIYNDNDLDRKN